MINVFGTSDGRPNIYGSHSGMSVVALRTAPPVGGLS